jgi:ABC-type amino acid transport substrate-binding protein
VNRLGAVPPMEMTLNEKSAAQFEVLWPLAKKAKRAASTATAVGDLSGKTVAELWDYIFRGEIIYPAIRERLRERYPGINFVDYTHFGDIVAGLAAKLRERRCDAVISGIGA